MVMYEVVPALAGAAPAEPAAPTAVMDGRRVYVWQVVLPPTSSRSLCGASRVEQRACDALARALRGCPPGTGGAVCEVQVSFEGDEYVPVGQVTAAFIDAATHELVWA